MEIYSNVISSSENLCLISEACKATAQMDPGANFRANKHSWPHSVSVLLGKSISFSAEFWNEVHLCSSLVTHNFSNAADKSLPPSWVPAAIPFPWLLEVVLLQGLGHMSILGHKLISQKAEAQSLHPSFAESFNTRLSGFSRARAERDANLRNDGSLSPDRPLCHRQVVLWVTLRLPHRVKSGWEVIDLQYLPC